MDVINEKKDMYVKATNVKLKSTSQILGESFYSMSPSQLYDDYTPNVSTEYNDYVKKKDLRKSTTYYYNHINYSGFDKVFNPTVIEPAVEYVLTLQIKFYLDKK